MPAANAYRITHRRTLLLLVLVMLCGRALVHAQTGGGQQAPVSQPPAPTNDSVYVPGSIIVPTDTSRAGRLRGWLREELRLYSLELVSLLDSLERTVQARMRQNLAMSPSDWMPTEGERRAREEEIRRGMDMDFVFPNAYVPLFGISTGAVFRALGLVDDVTPRITYTLMRTELVTVKIYTIEATLVTTLVDGAQRPGVYDFMWDLRDADGKHVRYGNYIAEVIAGGRLLLRKRIEAP